MSWLPGVRLRGRSSGGMQQAAALAGGADPAGGDRPAASGVRAGSDQAAETAQLGTGYLAMLLLTSVPLPIVGAALTVALYVGSAAVPPLGQRWVVLALGAAAAIVLWLLLAACAVPYASARRANAVSFGDLSLEFAEVESRLAAAPPSAAKRSVEALCANVRTSTDEQRREWRWLSGAGYVELWAALHRAQEALLMVEPVPAVLERAQQYERRLQDSTIVNAGSLLATLRRAAAALDPAAPAYLTDPTDAGGTVLAPPHAAPEPGKSGGASGGQGAAGAAAEATASPLPGAAEAPPAQHETRGDHVLARVAIRQVVRDVNEFRDRRRAGIVRVRNQLLRTVAFAGLLIYVLTALAVVVGVHPTALTAAAAVYLVGATVGLFNRLYQDSQADTASEEDFGLSVARLLHTPLFSGLAAIGGVVVTALLPLSVAASSPTAPATAANPTPVAAAPAPPAIASTPIGASQAGASAARPMLEQVFDLGGYPSSLLVAAVFGLTPSLLIGRLSQPIEQYKKDLKSTETQQGK